MTSDVAPYSSAAKYYDELIPDERDELLRELYWSLLDFWGESEKAPRCLDVGCGTGGILQLWRPPNVDSKSCGIDPSAEMIELARLNCPGYQFESVDLLSLETDHKFDWIVSTGNPINYIASDKRQKFFEKASDLLAPAGLLYFDFDTRRDIEEFWPGQTRLVESDTFRFEARYAYDAEHDRGVEVQHWSQLAWGEASFSETHYLNPISPAEVVSEMGCTRFGVPQFIHPETYGEVNDPNEFLTLGCIARV
jgi:SAM-dependent methyltransferase